MAVSLRNVLSLTQMINFLLVAFVYIVAKASAEIEPYDKSESIKTTSPIPPLVSNFCFNLSWLFSAR